MKRSFPTEDGDDSPRSSKRTGFSTPADRDATSGAWRPGKPTLRHGPLPPPSTLDIRPPRNPFQPTEDYEGEQHAATILRPSTLAERPGDRHRPSPRPPMRESAAGNVAGLIERGQAGGTGVAVEPRAVVPGGAAGDAGDLPHRRPGPRPNLQVGPVVGSNSRRMPSGTARAAVRSRSLNTERLNATAVNMLAEFLRANHPSLAPMAFEFWKIDDDPLNAALADLFQTVHKPGIPAQHHNGPLDYSATTLKSYFSSLSRVFAANRPCARGFHAEPFKSGVAVALEDRVSQMRADSKSSSGAPRGDAPEINATSASGSPSVGRTHPEKLPRPLPAIAAVCNSAAMANAASSDRGQSVANAEQVPIRGADAKSGGGNGDGSFENQEDAAKDDGRTFRSLGDADSDVVSVPDNHFHMLWNAVQNASDPVKHILRLFITTATLFGDRDGFLSHMRVTDFKHEVVNEGRYAGRYALVFNYAAVRSRGREARRAALKGDRRGSPHFSVPWDDGSSPPGKSVVVDMPEMGSTSGANNYYVLQEYLENRPAEAHASFWLNCSRDRMANRSDFYSSTSMSEARIASLIEELYSETGISNSFKCVNHSLHVRMKDKMSKEKAGDLQNLMSSTRSRRSRGRAVSGSGRRGSATQSTRAEKHVAPLQTAVTSPSLRPLESAPANRPGKTAQRERPKSATEPVRGIELLHPVESGLPHAMHPAPSVKSGGRHLNQPGNLPLVLPDLKANTVLQSLRDVRPVPASAAAVDPDHGGEANHAPKAVQSVSAMQAVQAAQAAQAVPGSALLSDWQPQSRPAQPKASGDVAVELLVKLGGAALTYKRTRHALAHERLRSVLEAVAAAYRRGTRMVICMGAGSFGHFEAEEGNVASGHGTRLAVASTHATVMRLSAYVVDSLTEMGMPAVQLSPFQLEVTGSDLGAGVSSVLRRGFVPVIHGDALYSSGSSSSIMSADTIVRDLASSSLCAGVRRVVFVSDVAGVYSAPPRTDELLTRHERPLRQLRVDRRGAMVDGAAVKFGSGDARAPDVTGGMAGKVRCAGAVAARLGEKTQVFLAGTQSVILQALFNVGVQPGEEVLRECTSVVLDGR